FIVSSPSPSPSGAASHHAAPGRVTFPITQLPPPYGATMTNPVSMMLGSFPFQSLGFGYQGLQRRVETPWADVAVVQDLNQQQWTGPTSEEVTIRGVLFPAEWPASLSGVIAAANSGLPMFLVSGDAD